MGLIYKVTSPSGKNYIGRTIRTLSERWQEHILEARTHPNDKYGCWLLNLAINKYGAESFKLTILEDQITDMQELMNQEEYWIKYYDSINPNKGYNRSPGKGGHIARSIIQYDLTGKIIKKWNNIGEILDYYNWNERNLYDCLSGGYSHFHNFLWKYADDNRNIKELIDKYNLKHGKLGGGHSIICLETNEIFPSIRALERTLNLGYGVINRRFAKNEIININEFHYKRSKS